MVGPQDDDGVFRATTFLECVEHLSQHGIGEADAGQVRAHAFPPDTGLEYPPMELHGRQLPT